MFGLGKPKDNAVEGTGPLVLLVGHCGFDSGGLKRVVLQAVPEARLEEVNSRRALEASIDRASLLLVNRKLDGSFGLPRGDHGDGVELIREIAASDHAPACVLISNFEDAQAAAVEAGARPGFGKKDLRAESAARSIRSALGLGQPQ